MTSPRLSMITLVAALVGIVLTGCSDALVFDLEAEVDEFTVPGDPHLHHDGAPLQKADIPPIEIAFGALSAGSVNLSGLRFFVTDTSRVPLASDEDTLDFLTAVSVQAVPNDPALPTIEIATWTGPAPEGATEIPLDVNDEYDLQPYLSAGFRLQIETAGVVPYDDVSLKGQAQFRVDPL